MNIVHVSKGEDYPFNKYSGMANKVEHQDRELQDASIETKASSLNCDNVAPSPELPHSIFVVNYPVSIALDSFAKLVALVEDWNAKINDQSSITNTGR